MSEIAHTFRGIERPNIRPDGSLQSVDCALRSFAQGYLEGVENQLYGVKVRRILRQVAETCTSSADHLLRTSDLVEGHVIDHHDVPTLEGWDQTLLYVRQECVAIHGPFNQHRSHDAGLTQASDKRHCLPVPHGRVRHQALSARAPTVKAHHVGGDCCLIDKYEAGSIKPALLADPASTRASHLGSLALCRLQAFFEGDAMASKKSRQ